MFRLGLMLATLLAATTAFAQQPSYNYINAAWMTVDLDAGVTDVDGNELSIGGAFEINDNWHIVADYASTDLDFGFDIDLLEIGAGYHYDVSSNASFFAELLYLQTDASANGFGSLDESGIGGRIGLRSNVTDRVELAGSISYLDLGNGLDGTRFDGAAWYSISREFSVGLVTTLEDDLTAFGIGGRVYF